MEFIVLNKGNDVLNPVAKPASGKEADVAICKQLGYRCTRASAGMMPQREGARI